jgi:hypothetical protein
VDHVEDEMAGYCSLQHEGSPIPKGCLQDTHFLEMNVLTTEKEHSPNIVLEPFLVI